MADRSAIEWTDATWTPIRARNLKTGKVGWHCEHVTSGCKGCYAEGFNLRLGTRLAFKPGHRADIELFLDEKMLAAPLRWKKPRMVFVCSMTDLFADFVADEWIDRIFAVMALCPQHTFQVLTKRSARMRDYLSDPTLPNRLGEYLVSASFARNADFLDQLDWPDVDAPATLKMPLPNVWLGVSAERQDEADLRLPDLLETPASTRFVSAEPLLAPIDFYRTSAAMAIEPHPWRNGPILQGIDWVIVGGESGPKARPMHPDWARTIRDQCAAAGTAFFFKQWGAWLPGEFGPPPELRWQGYGPIHDANQFPAEFDHEPLWDDGLSCVDEDSQAFFYRAGKKRAGRLLDGRTHDDMPERSA